MSVLLTISFNTYAMFSSWFEPKRTDGKKLRTLKDLSRYKILDEENADLVFFAYENNELATFVSKHWHRKKIGGGFKNKKRHLMQDTHVYYKRNIDPRLYYIRVPDINLCFDRCDKSKYLIDNYRGSYYRFYDKRGYYDVYPSERPSSFWETVLIQSAYQFLKKDDISVQDIFTAKKTLSLLKNKKVVPNPYYLLWMTQLRVGSKRSNLFKEVLKKLVKHTRGVENFKKIVVESKQARDWMHA